MQSEGLVNPHKTTAEQPDAGRLVPFMFNLLVQGGPVTLLHTYLCATLTCK